MKKITMNIQRVSFLCLLLLLLMNSKSKAQNTNTLTPLDSNSIPWTCLSEESSFGGNQSLLNQYKQSFETFRVNGSLPKPASGIYVIPVVVHVLFDAAHANSLAFNLSYNQIQWQIAALNAAFQRDYLAYTNGTVSHGAFAANAQIQFCLAQVPMGANGWTNANEQGVVRWQVPTAVLSHTMDLAGKNQLLGITHSLPGNFPFNNYLNVWLVNDITDPSNLPAGPAVIGYSNFPGSLSPSNPLDGVVIRHDVFGDNTVPYTNSILISQLNKGRIFVHEVGHYLGLFHTFSPMACLGDNTTNCLSQGDLLCDTPPSSLGNVAVCTATNSCPDNLGISPPGSDADDLLEDYMSYADDDCMNTFTNNQSNLMNGVLNTAWPIGRQDMTSTANLNATGLQNSFSCCPKGAVSAGFSYVVSGCNTVIFTNLMPPCNSNVNYLWTFGDGTQSTSLNPTHVYATEGVFTVVCFVTSSSGNSSQWTTTIDMQFSSYIMQQSAPTHSVCNGSDQSIYIFFGKGVNSVQLTDGANTITVNNLLSPATQTNIVIYTFVATTNVTYNLLPGVCNNLPLGSATFSVMNCCPNKVFNGDFELGTYTGFISDLDYNGSVFGSFYVKDPTSNIGAFQTEFDNIGIVPGSQTMLCNGWGGNNGIITITSGVHLGVEGRIWEQTITGLQPNTTYYVGYKTTRNKYNPSSYIPNNLKYKMRIKDNSGAIFTSPVIQQPIITNGAGFGFTAFNYTFTTPATVSPTYTFSIYQIDNFNYNFFDYAIDNITLQAMAPINVTISNVTNPNGSFCGTSTTAILTASGANTYLWQPGNTTVNPYVVTAANTTLYTVTGTSLNGCTSQATTLVNVTQPTCINLHTTGTNITIPANTTFLANASYTNYNFTCFGNIIIPANGGSSFTNCTFMMAPGTRVTMGNKSTLRVRFSHFYGCTGMWQGITMPGQNGAFLDMRNTVVEDAVWGVRVAAAGSTGIQNFPNILTIKNCLFNANITDVDYANTNTNQLSVSNTAFTSRCLGYDPPYVLLPGNINGSFYTSVLANAPFVAPLDITIPAPLYGILMYEYVNNPGQGTQIDLQTVNIFDKHVIGISTLNFNNLKIEKQIFVNGITGGKEIFTPVVNTGIYLTNSNASSSTSNPSNNFLITIGNSGNKGNKFGNLDYGIYATAPNQSTIRTIVKYNDFNVIKNTGIYYTRVPYTGPVAFTTSHNINNNTFNDCRNTAITVINSGKTGMSITNNTITNPINPAIEYKGIVISEVSNPSTARYAIGNNDITNINKGIKADNVYIPNIYHNTISLVPSTSSSFNFANGVVLKNCNAPSVGTNTITGLYTSANIALDAGLVVADCPKGNYTCNVIKNTLLGANYNGQNLSTTLRNNSFDNHAVAIYLANKAVIDVQGTNTSNGAVDNQFFNIGATQYHTYTAISTIGANSQFYIRNITNFAMTNNGFDLGSSVVSINNISNPDPFFDLCMPNPFGTFNSGLSSLADAVANPGLFNAALQRENHTSKRQLYEQLLRTTTTQNSTLQNFETTNVTSSLGRFTMVDSTLSEYFDGDISALPRAQNYNAFTAVNTIESYQQQFNGLYLQYLQTNNLSITEIGQVNSIAALCPYIDGTVVWQARAFAKLFNDTLEYTNTCEVITPPSPAAQSRMGKPSNIEITKNVSVRGKLIPNPNDGNFTLLLDKEVEHLDIKVYDVAGKEVCNNTLSNTSMIQLNCNELKNGIYIVKVYSNGEYLQSHKLVIQK